jgi:hypothetical protein
MAKVNSGSTLIEETKEGLFDVSFELKSTIRCNSFDVLVELVGKFEEFFNQVEKENTNPSTKNKAILKGTMYVSQSTCVKEGLDG